MMEDLVSLLKDREKNEYRIGNERYSTAQKAIHRLQDKKPEDIRLFIKAKKDNESYIYNNQLKNINETHVKIINQIITQDSDLKSALDIDTNGQHMSREQIEVYFNQLTPELRQKLNTECERARLYKKNEETKNKKNSSKNYIQKEKMKEELEEKNAELDRIKKWKTEKERSEKIGLNKSAPSLQ